MCYGFHTVSKEHKYSHAQDHPADVCLKFHLVEVVHGSRPGPVVSLHYRIGEESSDDKDHHHGYELDEHEADPHVDISSFTVAPRGVVYTWKGVRGDLLVEEKWHIHRKCHDDNPSKDPLHIGYCAPFLCKVWELDADVDIKDHSYCKEETRCAEEVGQRKVDVNVIDDLCVPLGVHISFDTATEADRPQEETHRQVHQRDGTENSEDCKSTRE